MTECIARERLDFHPQTQIDVVADGPELSSDAGLLILRHLDEQLDLTHGFSKLVPDERDPSRVVHTRHEQVRQRVLQIAMGYEDCNDATKLRHDPMFKLVHEQLPNDSRSLSSQSSLSRFENAVSPQAIRAMMRYLERTYVESLPEDTELVILDIDPTDDPTHGHQELSCFNGYYDQHMYSPNLVIDGVSGELITALLRGGKAAASRGARSILGRVIRRLKERFPDVHICVRGDAHFGIPRVMRFLDGLNEELGSIDYLLGIQTNKALQRKLGEELPKVVKRRCEDTGRAARLFAEFEYRTRRSWIRSRRIIAKAEHLPKGANHRFVVTSFEGFPPEFLYRAYCGRGQCENHIKDFKRALFADRLSCHKFFANFFRLLLHVLAYRLMMALRNALKDIQPSMAHHQFDTLRLRLLKVAAVVTQSVRRVLIRLPRSFPLAHIFCQLLVWRPSERLVHNPG